MGGFGIDRYISVEHFAIASAGFFVLLASFAGQGKEIILYGYVKKKTKLYCIYRCFNTEFYPFQNLSLGFILKIFLKFRKFQPQYSYKKYSH